MPPSLEFLIRMLEYPSVWGGIFRRSYGYESLLLSHNKSSALVALPQRRERFRTCTSVISETLFLKIAGSAVTFFLFDDRRTTPLSCVAGHRINVAVLPRTSRYRRVFTGLTGNMGEGGLRFDPAVSSSRFPPRGRISHVSLDSSSGRQPGVLSFVRRISHHSLIGLSM